ncbi:MAG: FAD:protein FMN transferase [Sphingomonadaceae bacterium]
MVKREIYNIRFNAMASSCNVLLVARGDSAAAELAQVAIDEVHRIERKYSRYRADSVVSRINGAAGGEWLELDEETDGLIRYAATLYEISEGRFDISTGVLRRAWDFSGRSPPRVPTCDELQGLLALTGWDKVQRDGRSLRLLQAGMELDFGGIGKEYAADRAAAALQACGLECGYVNLGGDLSVIGPQPDGAPWPIVIQDPRNSDASIAGIPVAAGGLATSGDYERFFEVDGRRYCHILDGRNGYPVQYWRSVSVLAPLASAAGSCATIAMLMGEQGLSFLESSGFAYLAQDEQGRIYRKGLH